MRIRISIAEETREIRDWPDGDIIGAIERRRRDRVPVCVQFHINAGCADMRLSTPSCSRGGGGRPPNKCERRLFDLWQELHLNEPEYPVFGVLNFKKQLPLLLN